MKSHEAIASLLLLSSMSVMAADGSLAGKWTLTSDIGGSLRERNCSFKQQGTAFSGACKDDESSVQVAGSVTGDAVSFQYAVDVFGQTMPLTCTGKLSGSRVSGVLALGPLAGTCTLEQDSAAKVSANADQKCRGYLGRTIEGATVTRARVAPATAARPEMCIVRGEMPQDLDFEVRMPTRWNGRTVFIGGGGFDGSIGNRFPSAVAADPRQPAYATIATNHGHDARVMPDASFALDVQMLSEYAYLAVPRVLAPAKTILRTQYGPAFDKAKVIYEGCSGGGRQALIQAQRYPDLFDGVVARAPATAFVPQFLWYGKVAKLHAAPGGALTRRKVEAIGAAVRARCDGLDGLQDGIISRQDACKFDPAELACKAGEKSDACLTPPQVATARAYYEPTNVGNGRYTWPGFMPGGETPTSWLNNFTDRFDSPLYNGFVRYMLVRDANVDPLTVDPEKHLARLDYLSAAIDANDPDLSRFKASGGKLILWTGQADWLITANNATAYYQSVVDAMGGQAVDEFMEYYTSPDVQHCAGGAGADRIDLVTPMFEWLEKGTRPSARTIVATKVAAGPKPLSRPLCRFPRYPKYMGGDPDSAASFICAGLEDTTR